MLMGVVVAGVAIALVFAYGKGTIFDIEGVENFRTRRRPLMNALWRKRNECLRGDHRACVSLHAAAYGGTYDTVKGKMKACVRKNGKDKCEKDILQKRGYFS